MRHAQQFRIHRTCLGNFDGANIGKVLEYSK